MGAAVRIDTVWDIPSIQAEYEQYLGFLSDSKKALVDLYNTTKSFKDATFSTLAQSTQQLATSIGNAATSTNRAAAANDALTQSVGGVVKSVAGLSQTYSSAGKSLEDNIKNQIRYKAEIDDLKGKLAELNSAIAVNGNATEEQANQQVELVKQMESVKQASTELQRTIRLQVKEQDAASGSIDEMKANYDRLYQAYRKLAVEDQQSEFGKGLSTTLGELKQKILDLDIPAGNFSENIGNYAGAFEKAFNVLKEQLSSAKAQMTDLEQKGKSVVNNLTGGNPIGFDPNKFKGQVTSFAGNTPGGAQITVAAGDAAAYQAAADKAQVLENNIERLSVGFKTTRQESRAFAEAASQVGLALGLESEEFQTFDKAVGHTQKAINDIKEATKFQSSDAKLIKGIADGASTLAGAFGAAQAASALFAGDNEDLQKQMAKFQQLLVLINGLQSVANGLQAESGGMQLLLSAKTNLLNAAKATQLLLTTRAIQIVSAETAATEVNADVKEADVAATGEQVVAEEALTVAVTENTEATAANAVAQGGAKAATSGLATSIIAGGITALLIGAGVALALLTAKLIGYGETIGITIAQQKEIIDATKELNDSLEAQAKILETLDDAQGKYYSNLISNAQAAGANQYALLLAQQRSDEAQAEAAKAEVDRLGATSAGYIKAAHDLQVLKDKQEEAAKLIIELDKTPENRQTSAQKRQIKAAQDNIQLWGLQAGVAQDTFDKMTAARNKFSEFTQKSSEDETKFNKLSLDNQLDDSEKAEELRANLVKLRNSIILSDERSSLRQRVAVIKSSVQQENDILDAQVQKIKGNNSNYINGQLTDTSQGQVDDLKSKQRENILKGADDMRKLTKQVTDRQKDDALQAFKDQQDAVIAQAERTQQGKNGTYDLLNGNKGPTIEDRSTAIGAESVAQRKELEAQRDRDLQKASDDAEDNQEKIKEINQKYSNDILKIQQDTVQKYFDLENQALKESLSQWDKYYAHRSAQIQQNESEEINSLEDRNLSDRKYAQDRQKIEDNAATARAALAVQNAEIERNATKAGTKERSDADAKLSQSGQALSDSVKKQSDDKRAALVSDIENVKEQADDYAGAIGKVLEVGYNTQKAHLEQLEARQQKAYDQNVKNISDSLGSEEEKAIRLKILDGQRQEQNEANARKQRQLDIQKAEFDKAKAIMDIILNTTVAVVKALDDPFLAAAIAVAGAAELAVAIATPIPHYKLGAGIAGRPDHMGGPMVVGDGGVPEFIQEPGKPGFWSPDTPTLMNMSAYTKVIPPDRINDMIHSGMFVNDRGVLQQATQSKELQKVTQAIMWQTGRIESALAKNKTRVVNRISVDTNWGTYINNSIFDKK